MRLILFLQLFLTQLTFAQENLLEKVCEFEVDNSVGIAQRMVEIVDDSILLVVGPLNDFHLYDIEKKELIKSKIMNKDWNKGTDLVQSINGENFIVSYEWGLVLLDQQLNILRKIKSKGKELHEIKVSKNGTVWQRTEKMIREIDIEKGRVKNEIKRKDYEHGYDIEIDEKGNLLITNFSSIIKITPEGEEIDLVKIPIETEELSNVIYSNNEIIIPSTFSDKVYVIEDKKEKNIKELVIERPTVAIKKMIT